MKIKCIQSNQEYLVDSGASLSIIPRQENDVKNPYQLLKAANGTPIATYGVINKEIVLSKDLSLKHAFIKADVTCPILGADFMKRHKMWLNMERQVMVHEDTGTAIYGQGIVAFIHAVEQLHDDRTKAMLQKVPNAIYKPGEGMPKPHPEAPYLEIKTKGTLPSCRPRRLAPKALRLAREHFNELLKQGKISESEAPCSSPLHTVPKKDGTMRFVGDYRVLNSKSVQTSWPIPYVQDASAQMAGMTIFSKVDLKAAFEHLPIHPRDMDKTTVVTPFGSFKFHFGNYGLKNAGQTFQLFIDRVLRNLSRKENGVEKRITYFAFVDDIMVASKDEESHEKDVLALLERLAEFNLKINLKKCEFFKKEIEFLGHMFCKEGIKPLKDRVEAILNYQRPKTLGGLKRFLGRDGISVS